MERVCWEKEGGRKVWRDEGRASERASERETEKDKGRESERQSARTPASAREKESERASGRRGHRGEGEGRVDGAHGLAQLRAVHHRCDVPRRRPLRDRSDRDPRRLPPRPATS
eukprot:713039-Rhodomonas_salina.1